MTTLDYVNSIQYDGFPTLWVQGKVFHWNGFFWDYVGFNKLSEMI